MKLDNQLAWAMLYGMNTYKSIAKMEKIFVLWMKDGIRFVTRKNLLNEMMKYKPIRITRIK